MRERFIMTFAMLGAILLSNTVCAQSLLDMLEEDSREFLPGTEYTQTTFFSNRIINGQSVEGHHPGDLIFIISHHFGRLNQGAYEMWGLDQATIRLGLEYGVNERLSVYAGRSSYEKTFDGFFKYKLLRQQSGKKEIPITLSYFSGVYLKSQKWAVQERDYAFRHRMSYVQQLLIARKFSRDFSLQLTPAWVHSNLMASRNDPNQIFVLGAGGRMALSPWASLNAEYFYRFDKPLSFETFNAFSVGFDFDTGGHIFQLHFTNAQPMFEKAFLTETTGNWLKGDIYFGFNITRVFGLK